ncbi:PspA/IM30 family protein [Salipaludibacillus sp. LMS25]|jgi:phage shock protein A|uniref:PspA/IM30 family protein n=1 Tax=Salipaludibacillus sp. LMS25 TaxID=2924031 RepID=UPI0020D1CF35|nr:PspA/IM30 family protein [Salipaludibacillus sp. LMS25]UTR16090.1 PspA/IM30 family protein [Salipaludibacillus sp. LMS25]
MLWLNWLKRLFREDEEHPQTEDPLHMVDELLGDLTSELEDMKVSLNKQLAAEKRLKRRLDEAKVESWQREKDARSFLTEGDDDSARLALLKKEQADKHVQEIASLYATAQTHKNDIIQHINEQVTKYERLQQKKHDLQMKRNFPSSSTVNDIEETMIVNEASGETELSQRETDDENERVEKKLEELKHSIKNRN